MDKETIQKFVDYDNDFDNLTEAEKDAIHDEVMKMDIFDRYEILFAIDEANMTEIDGIEYGKCFFGTGRRRRHDIIREMDIYYMRGMHYPGGLNIDNYIKINSRRKNIRKEIIEEYNLDKVSSKYCSGSLGGYKFHVKNAFTLSHFSLYNPFEDYRLSMSGKTLTLIEPMDFCTFCIDILTKMGKGKIQSISLESNGTMRFHYFPKIFSYKRQEIDKDRQSYTPNFCIKYEYNSRNGKIYIQGYTDDMKNSFLRNIDKQFQCYEAAKEYMENYGVSKRLFATIEY